MIHSILAKQIGNLIEANVALHSGAEAMRDLRLYIKTNHKEGYSKVVFIHLNCEIVISIANITYE